MGAKLFPCGRTDGYRDMAKLIVTFRNVANAHKKSDLIVVSVMIFAPLDVVSHWICVKSSCVRILKLPDVVWESNSRQNHLNSYGLSGHYVFRPPSFYSISGKEENMWTPQKKEYQLRQASSGRCRTPIWISKTSISERLMQIERCHACL